MWWSVIKEAATNWSSHKDARQGAALVYYSVVSLGPITAIVIAVAGLLFGHDAVTAQVMSFTKAMLGETGAKAVEAMLAGASRPASGILATISADPNRRSPHSVLKASPTFRKKLDESRRTPGRRYGTRYHERVFVGVGDEEGVATGAEAGAAVTMLSAFNSSGLNTNSLSCGVSMACNQACRRMPMSPR